MEQKIYDTADRTSLHHYEILAFKRYRWNANLINKGRIKAYKATVCLEMTSKE